MKEEQTPPAEHQLFYEHEVVRYWARNNATAPEALIEEFDSLICYYVDLMCYNLKRKQHDELNKSKKNEEKVAWRQKEPTFSYGLPSSRNFSTSWDKLVETLKIRRKKWFHNFMAQGETLEDGFDSSNVSFLSLRDFTQGCKKDEALSLPDFDYDTYPIFNGMTKELEGAMCLLSSINNLRETEKFPIQSDKTFARRFVDRAIKEHNPAYVYYTGDSYGGVVASHLLHTAPNDGHKAVIFNSPLLTGAPSSQAKIVRLMGSDSPLRHMGEAEEEHALPSHDKSALNFVQKDINKLADIKKLVSQKNLSAMLQKYQDDARKLETAYRHWVKLTNEVTERANAARPPAGIFSWGSSPAAEFKKTREETASKHWFEEDTFSTLMRSHGHLVPKGMYPDLTMPDAGDMNETEPNVDKEGEETPPSMGSEEGSYPLLLPQNTADHEADSEFSMENLLTRPMPRNPQHDLGLLVDDLMYWSEEGRSLAQQRAVKVRHSIKEQLQLKGVLSTAYDEYRSFMCLKNFCEYIPENMEKAKGNVKERLEYFYENWPKGSYAPAKALRDQIEEIHDATEKATTETKALQSQLQQHGELAQLDEKLKFFKANFQGLQRAIEEYNSQCLLSLNHLTTPTEPTQSIEDTLDNLQIAYRFLPNPTSSTHPSKRMLTLLQELALSEEGKKTLTKIMQEYVSELGNVKNTYETENNAARQTLQLWKEWNDKFIAALPTLKQVFPKSRSEWMTLLNSSFLTTEQIDQEAEKAGIYRPFKSSLLGRTSRNNPETGDVEYIDTFLESRKLEVKRLNDSLEEVNTLLQAESSWYNTLTQKSYDCDSLNKALEKCLNHHQILESTQDEEFKTKLELQFMKERLHLQQEIKEHEARFQTVRTANASNS